MNLNEIKKMVVTSLIQERVGYYGAQDGDVGGPADEPDIAGIVKQSEDDIKQMMAAQKNVLEAPVAQVAEIVAPAMVQAGVPGDEVTQMVEQFLADIKEAVRKAVDSRPTPLDTDVEGN